MAPVPRRCMLSAVDGLLHPSSAPQNARPRACANQKPSSVKLGRAYSFAELSLKGECHGVASQKSQASNGGRPGPEDHAPRHTPGARGSCRACPRRCRSDVAGHAGRQPRQRADCHEPERQVHGYGRRSGRRASGRTRRNGCQRAARTEEEIISDYIYEKNDVQLVPGPGTAQQVRARCGLAPGPADDVAHRSLSPRVATATCSRPSAACRAPASCLWALAATTAPLWCAARLPAPPRRPGPLDLGEESTDTTCADGRRVGQ